MPASVSFEFPTGHFIISSSATCYLLPLCLDYASAFGDLQTPNLITRAKSCVYELLVV